MSNLIPNVMIVDDEPSIRQVLQLALEQEGYRCLCAADGEEALRLLEQEPVALALLDINLPGMNGIELLKKIQEESPDTAFIMVTAQSEVNIAIEAMKLGATDYVTKPFNIDQLLMSVQRALDRRDLFIENREYHQKLEDQVRLQTTKIQHQKDAIDDLFTDTVAALAGALEAKDRYTEGHSRRVTDYSVLLAKKIKLPVDLVREIERGGLLHDIGKISIPDAILTKEGKLTEAEFAEVKGHPQHGWAIVRRIRRMSDTVAECVRSHHERWDGKGYPDELRGTRIPLPGRILAIADAFDAMTSTRSYRNAMSVDKAREQIHKHSGQQFDPKLAAAFLTLTDPKQGSGGNILVVDDDPAITDLFAATLTSQGHRLVALHSGDQALREVAEEPFDIVYLDLNMPGIDGVETLHLLRKIRPSLFVVFITGTPDDPRLAPLIADGSVTCITKPFGVRDIRDITSGFLKSRSRVAKNSV